VRTESTDLTGNRLIHRADKGVEAWVRRHGDVGFLAPERLEAGAAMTMTIDYRCGMDGLRPGDAVAVAWRLPGDWGTPQWSDPLAPDFVTVRAEGAIFDLAYEDQGGVKPWNHLFAITAAIGSVPPDGVVRIMGDRRAGSSGWESQTSAAARHVFMVVRPNGCLGVVARSMHRDHLWEALRRTRRNRRRTPAVREAAVGVPP
jgi:hypothetical protein